MIRFAIFNIILFTIMPLAVISQSKDLQIKRIPLYSTLPATVLDGDTVGVCNLSPVVVISERAFTDSKEAMKYYLLRYEVKQTYPYAVKAAATFQQCEATLQTMNSESDKRQYLKKMDEELKDQYKEDLKKLSPEEGRILMKLINRESGTTSYEMVKELRGSLSAFMWNSVARLFGNNMKDTYNPETEDKEIENIVQLIQTGAI
jgi:hypothetical protein